MIDTYLYRVLLVPTAVFLSVIFGGSYGSGREVMEFISKYGPHGGLFSIGVTMLTYTAILFLGFEIARLFRAYEYRSFCDALLGKAWFLYEIVIMIGMILTLSIVGSVAGTLMNDHFGLPVWMGTVAVLVVVITLNYLGRELIEQSMMVSVTALFASLLAVVYFVLINSETSLQAAFSDSSPDYSSWKGALKYAITGTGFLPLLLYCARDLQTRAESFVAAAACGLVAVLPAIAFHAAFMTEYPAITGEALPTYFIFEKSSPAWALNLYMVVLFVLICQTGVGVLQGLIERLDAWQVSKKGKPLSRTGHGMTAGFMMVASLSLGSMGVVALILRGYTILSASFLVVFTIPLLTWGVYLVFVKSRR
jgi:uncharacterized membrane protein YkvI